MCLTGLNTVLAHRGTEENNCGSCCRAFCVSVLLLLLLPMSSASARAGAPVRGHWVKRNSSDRYLEGFVSFLKSKVKSPVLPVLQRSCWQHVGSPQGGRVSWCSLLACAGKSCSLGLCAVRSPHPALREMPAVCLAYKTKQRCEMLQHSMFGRKTELFQSCCSNVCMAAIFFFLLMVFSLYFSYCWNSDMLLTKLQWWAFLMALRNNLILSQKCI